jgi:sulfofructose kinase
MTESSIIVVGHAALDRVYRIEAFPPKPTKIRSLEHVECGGGMGANAAAAIARLGGAVELWARTGSDDVGAKIRAFLKAEGVNIDHVRAHEGARSATAAIIVDHSGERLIVSERDHAMPLTADWLPLDRIASCAVVVSDLNWKEGTRAAFRRARSLNVPTLLDADVDSAALPPEILDDTDFAIFSSSGLRQYVDGPTDDARLAKVVARGVRHAGVTLGGGGYRWLNDKGSGYQGVFETEIVDTTGAGDAFHGAFAWALAHGYSDAECARIAAAVAALKCRKLGARAGLPTLSELNSFLLAQTHQGLPAGSS